MRSRSRCRSATRFAVERMRERAGGMHPFESMVLERHGAEEGRTESQRIDGRADVVEESPKRQLFRPGSAPNGRVRLEQQNRQTAPRELDAGRQTIRSGAHGHGVVHRITFQESALSEKNSCLSCRGLVSFCRLIRKKAP